MRGQYLPVLGAFLCLFVDEVLTQCNGRRVLTSSSGIISDGAGNYTNVAHCEWLINGHGNTSIQLEFHKMNTECSYDFLFIYDGDSYQKPLLASLSGDQLPKPLLATSGYMLIYFFSDRNYELAGFEASYKITKSPQSCAYEGDCRDGKCVRIPPSSEIGCEIHFCPNDCHSTKGQGQCVNSKRCECEQGFSGEDCSLATESGYGNNTWYLLASDFTGFRPRTSHAGVFISSLNSFWVFGGFTLNEILDELIFYNMSTNQWITIPKSAPWPEGRYLHAMVALDYGFVMFGGQLVSGNISNELWYFDAVSLTWALISPKPGRGHLPALASHTLTLGMDWIYLFGGKTKEGFFSSEMYRIRTKDLSDCERIFIKGGKKSSRRLAGHSAVFHRETNSIIIFGGHSTNTAQFSRLRNNLHIFNIANSFWSMVVAPKDLPSQRAYHTANILGDYMVVYGGNTHIYDDRKLNLCYDSAIYYYHLGCHMWISPTNFNKEFPGLRVNRKPNRRFGHVATVAYGDTLLVSGGYSGFVMGDLLAIKVAPAIALHQSVSPVSYDHCTAYSKDRCLTDPACMVCDKPVGLCVNRATPQLCKGKEATCSGYCSSLHSCDSCLNLGGHQAAADNIAWHYQKFHHCGWCVQQEKCLPQEFFNTCTDVPAYNTASGKVGWWNSENVLLTELHQCLTEDKLAGLYFARYRHPANFTYPDELGIIRKLDTFIEFEKWLPKETIKGASYTGMLMGYIHPLNVSEGYPINVSVGVSQSEVSVYLSKDDNPQNKELVASGNFGSVFSNIFAHRPDDSALFPNVARGYKYYVQHNATMIITGAEQQPKAKIELRRNSSDSYKPWTAEFLEPIRTQNCSQYYNCLACLADASCGWCTEHNICLHRDKSENLNQPTCGKEVERHLVLTSGDCPTCMDYVDCHGCVQDNLCEWVDGMFCLRRGRFPDSVLRVEDCLNPCQSHSTCDTCLSDQNECAWCENLNSCFTFSEYMTRFMYGQCLKWLDWEARHQMQLKCDSCESFTNCNDCMENFGCGWCSVEDNPVIGRCMKGDFTGPLSGSNCTAIMSETRNVTETASWSYAFCPDVEECELGLDDCHDNATCINTPDGFNCTCHRGFVGNGKDTCEKTCYHQCLEGICSGLPDYKCLCSLGWTGDNCSTNCGCNNHSTCDLGVGVCDQCQQNTTGNHCQFCLPGTFGDPLQLNGCEPCMCNEHGNEALGVCDNVTGKCYCEDSTEGHHCEHCQPNYYGDSRSGGKCYLECDDRKELTNIKYGSLGSFRGPWASSLARTRAYCLWVLTVFSDIDSPTSHQVIPNITLKIDPNLAVRCPEDYVYVYDGLPYFASGRQGGNSLLLGSFCGQGYLELPSLTARSGILTIFYQSDMKQGVATIGFNASYFVNGCPNDCNHGNKHCVDGRCICKQGYKGDNCEREICPQNCTALLNHGQCSEDGCLCNLGFVGSGCEVALPSNMAAIQPRFYDDSMVNKTILARSGHTMSKCGNDSLYVFGGYSFRNGILSDLLHLNITTGIWTLIEPISEELPQGRYFHSAICMPDLKSLYIFGGLVEDETDTRKHKANREMWKFGLESLTWALREVPKSVHVLAGHTMTQISDTKLMLIGGFSVEDYFSNKVYEYDTSKGLTAWKDFTIQSEGSSIGAQPVGLFGHTAVFHARSNSIYVFGGYVYKTDAFGPSNTMYSLDLDNKEWSIIQPEIGETPIPRYFHAAIGREDDMVVMGGLDASNEATESVMIYRYTCNTWIKLTNPDQANIVGKMPAAMGMAAVAIDNDIYTFGGYNGLTLASLTKLTIPMDACQIVTDGNLCRQTIGCSGCTVHSGLLGNQSYCFSSNQRPPDSCNSVNVTMRQGTLCTEAWLDSRDCGQYTNCSQCLAVYPQFKQARMACKWCTNCNKGQCVKSSDKCNVKKCVGVIQTELYLAKECVEQRCQATDCHKCKDLESTCDWTKQFKRTGEVNRSVASVARYKANCIEQTRNTNYIPQLPVKCPNRCHQFTSCHKCLDSESAEGGAETCVWSDRLKQCVPAAAVPLLCTGGRCGYLVSDPWVRSSRCPVDCAFHTRCSTCLKSAGCGWCAFGGWNGSGVCMAGGLHNPLEGVCVPGEVKLATETQKDAARNRSLERTEPIFWSFMTCPPENECLNNHHNCNNETEDCKDTPDSYQCVCKSGYAKAHGQLECVPVCHQGCIRGKCVRPDNCQCDFGWVGRNCSVECQCNKHSDCLSETETDICLRCHNNTMGPRCNMCKPLFVGDPRGGKSCVSCSKFCYNHTDICVSKEESVKWDLGPETTNMNTIKSILKYEIKQGSKEEDAVCISCERNTTGLRCEDCQPGHFRIRLDNKLFQPCLKCQCNGHSSTCDELTGDNCDCQNNTDTSCNKDSKEKKPCWQKQCSECKEYFLGHPTNGHQCYRHMTMEQDYCFDPNTQSRCSQDPSPLLQGRTVFFSVQPKYLNVDIRITVDVTDGAADVYFSPCDDTFLVDVDQYGFHTVFTDPNYHILYNGQSVFNGQRRAAANCSHDKTSFRRMEIEANELNTFVTVDYTKTVLLVKNVRFRLVITLPLDVHDLQFSRFYLILQSRVATASNKTFGSLYFRQDQPHIDLFVFFSVFFSCFFLFLAKCVLLWKVKQTFDARRSRQMRAREMKHMASRPFARVLVYIEQDHQIPFQSAYLRRNRLPKMRNSRLETLNSNSHPTNVRDNNFSVAPIAVEPTDDGIAAVGTVILRLPGGNSAPNKLALGSALTMRLHSGPSNSHHHQKVTLRRRYSASFA